MFALACASAGADVIIHHAHSDDDAESLRTEIDRLGRQAWIVKADFTDSSSVLKMIQQLNLPSPLHGLVNSGSIFESLSFESTSFDDWNRHIAINLTAPFLLSQAFAKHAEEGARIVNILDWRALRPGRDHFPYTVSKSALAALTKSLAAAFAPKIIVNGLALGAILPPADGGTNPEIVKSIPIKRWAEDGEIQSALIFLLTAPAYITGEIIHVDGGRHLV